MPQVFRIGSYWVYFWSNENDPLEPIHVHIAEGKPKANGTKVWITSRGKCLLDNNNSKISQNILKNILRIIEARSDEIIKKWEQHFGEVDYYC